MTPQDLLQNWLTRQLPDEMADWLQAQVAYVRAGVSDRKFNLLISLAPRKLGKADFVLGVGDYAAAEHARPGWDPGDWSVDQAGRILLLLACGETGLTFAKRLRGLLATADLGESIAFLRGLPLYPDPQLHLPSARQGIRSGMRPIFEAVAHRNPYPAGMFDEAAWNQLVLKALFIDSTLKPIQGLDRRANPTLMRMLCDYALERWAAGRPVSPELWRCVGPWADAEAREDLMHVLRIGNEAEKAAAREALEACLANAKRLEDADHVH